MAQQKTIKEWRTERGMTQQQLSDAIGASSVQLVYQWETNRRGMTARNLQAVASALGVSMDDIVLPDPDAKERT